MRLVTLSPEEEADYWRELHAHRPTPLEDHPVKWLRRL